MCTEYSIVRTIRLKNSLMPHKHLKRQNVIQLHQSSDLNSNKTITECLTDKTRHVTAAQCIYNLHHWCGVELETKIREDFPSRRKPENPTILCYTLYVHFASWIWCISSLHSLFRCQLSTFSMLTIFLVCVSAPDPAADVSRGDKCGVAALCLQCYLYLHIICTTRKWDPVRRGLSGGG